MLRTIDLPRCAGKLSGAFNGGDYDPAMVTKAGTIEYLVEQCAAGPLSARKMFGEYGLYRGTKLVALVCDDRLFVKPTQGGRAYIGDVVEAAPYPGAKPSFLIEGDRWDDGDWLKRLLEVTAAELPEPVAKKRR